MKNLNEILNSQQHLNIVKDDIHTLKEIHKLWLELSELDSKRVNQTDFNPTLFEQCLPLGIRNQTLSIACSSSIIANHLRFLQHQLLEKILNKGIKKINKLHFSVITDSNSNNIFKNNAKKNHFEQTSSQNMQLHTRNKNIDLETIETLEQFKRCCSSEVLRNSTERLIKQLKEKLD